MAELDDLIPEDQLPVDATRALMPLPVAPGMVIEPSIAPLPMNVIEPNIDPMAQLVDYSPVPTDLTGEAGLLGLFAGNPVDPNNIQNFVDNITGQQYPVNLQTGQPVSPLNEPVSFVEGPALLPGGPTQVQEKIGTDAVTSAVPSAEGQVAAEGMRSAATELDKVMARQVEQAAANEQAQAKMDNEKYNAAQIFDRQSQEILEMSKREIEASMDNMNRLREELKNTPWESYWGTKDVGDKLMIGLAVGLGAFSQAQIGGQNIAMQVLQSSIEDHNTSQREKLNGLRDRMKQEGTLSGQKQDALKAQFDIMNARKVLNYDMIDKQLATLQTKVQTPDAALKIEQLRQEARFTKEQEIAKLQTEFATKTTTAREVFQIRNATEQEGMNKRADGKDMDASQFKELGYALDAGFSAKTLEQLEATGITNTPAWTQVKNAMLNEGRSLGLLQGPVAAAEAALNFGMLRDKYLAGNPALQSYVRNASAIVDARLRKVTGATINPNEYINEVLMMLPDGPSTNIDPAHQQANIADAQRMRRHKLVTARDLSGSPRKLWFEVKNAGQ